MLEAVPNVSEGRRPEVVSAIGAAFAQGVELLARHTDTDHHRSVYVLVGDAEKFRLVLRQSSMPR